MTAANRVWSTAQLRSLIINQMDRKGVHSCLCLDKSSFPDMVRGLYHTFQFKHYYSLLNPTLTYHRRKLYIESIREIDLNGAVPLLYGINGFSHLLDMFPLVHRIKACDVELVTPSRLLWDDKPSTPSATLFVDVCFPSAIATSSREAYDVALRAFPTCQVVHDIEIEEGQELDWTLSLWDVAAKPEARLSPDSWTRRILDELDWDAPIPIALILCRNIRSLGIVLHDWGDADKLFSHLDRRKAVGYDDNTSMTIYGLRDATPYFIRRYPHLTHFEAFDMGSRAPSLSGILLFDWDGRSRGPRTALRHLSLDFDFEDWNKCPDSAVYNMEEDVDEVIRCRSSVPSFASLKTLTLLFDKISQDFNRDLAGIATAPRFSQIAKGLVQLGGTQFELKFKELGICSRRDRCHEMMRAQLKREVMVRQEMERKRPRHIKFA